MDNRIKAVRDEFILEIGQMQTKLGNFEAKTKWCAHERNRLDAAKLAQQNSKLCQ